MDQHQQLVSLIVDKFKEHDIEIRRLVDDIHAQREMIDLLRTRLSKLELDVDDNK